ncbi:MAG: DUF3352 domain-containing protein [Solirubrobacteraceae bacterium]
MAPGPHRRRAAIALGAAAVLLLVVLVLALSSGGDAPPTGAARLVPGNSLVYAHFSTDAGRKATQRAIAVATRFPSYAKVRDGLLARLRVTGRGTGVDFGRDIRPWLGKEAAFALVPEGTVAKSLIVLDIAHKEGAKLFLGRLGRPTGVSTHGGSTITEYGSQGVAFVSHYLLAGAPEAIAQGIDAQAGRRPPLAKDANYKRAAAKEPAGRFADVYAPVTGIRRVLAPRGGLFGTLASLVDQPALAGTAISLSAASNGVRAKVHSTLRTEGVGTPNPAFASFEPSLPDRAPAPALAYVDLAGLDRALPRLLAATGSASLSGRLGLLLAQAGQGLKGAGVDVERDVLPLFRDEAALLITPHNPLPTLTLISRARDEQKVREAFAQLQAPLAQVFAPGGGPGQAPTFTDRIVAGVHAFQLHLSPTFELDYAVFDGQLVASTSLDGIAAARSRKGRIASDRAFQTVLAKRPKEVTSLVFLDLSQLLSLGEQIGLSQDARYTKVRGDLKRIHGVGFVSSRGENDTTAELFLQIP